MGKIKEELINLLTTLEGMPEEERQELVTLLTQSDPNKPENDYAIIIDSEQGIEEAKAFIDVLFRHFPMLQQHEKNFEQVANFFANVTQSRKIIR